MRWMEAWHTHQREPRAGELSQLAVCDHRVATASAIDLRACVDLVDGLNERRLSRGGSIVTRRSFGCGRRCHAGSLVALRMNRAPTLLRARAQAHSSQLLSSCTHRATLPCSRPKRAGNLLQAPSAMQPRALAGAKREPPGGRSKRKQASDSRIRGQRAGRADALRSRDRDRPPAWFECF